MSTQPWDKCRRCGRQCGGAIGLHRHLAMEHGQEAWDYYVEHPTVGLDRLRAESVEAQPTSLVGDAAIGACWVHQSRPDRWGARLRIAGCPTKAAYRVALALVTGELHENLFALHACDNPQCVNPLHLWWGSASENAIDREEKNRGRTSRYDTEAAEEMARRYLKDGESVASIADVFACSVATVRRLIGGEHHREGGRRSAAA